MASEKYMRYCRLCAKKKDSSVLQSLVENGQELCDITHKISALNIHFSSEDKLPQEICHNCLPRVEMTFLFITACRKAQCKLIQLAHSGVKFDETLVIPQQERKTYTFSSDRKQPCSKSGPIGRVEKYLNKSHNTPHLGVFSLDNEQYDVDNELDAVKCEIKIDPVCNNDEELGTIHEKETPSDIPNTQEHLDIHQCDSCDKAYRTVSGLKYHNQTVHCKTPLLCEVCGKAFRHKVNLNKHRKTHLGEEFKKFFTCHLCDKKFAAKILLRSHINAHYNLKPYSCKLCEKTFHGSEHLLQHMGTHEAPTTLFECAICGKQLLRRNALRVHIKKHSLEKKIGCKICGERFDSRQELTNHSMEVHTQEEKAERRRNHDKNVVECPVCHKLFSRGTFPAHSKQHQAGDELILRCEVCGKGLAGRSSLAYHMKAFHSEDKGAWRCQFCGEGFMTRDLCRRHEYKHTGDTPFKCSQCEKSFRSRTSLRQHSLVHQATSSKYMCQVCDKRFKRKSALDVHSRKHSGNLPFSCSHCSKRFAQKNDMLKHQTARHTKEFHCSKCDLKFPNEKKCNLHKATCSKRESTEDKESVQETAVNDSKLDAQDESANVIHNASPIVIYEATSIPPEEVHYLCTLCNVTFDSEQRLDRHFRGFHGGTELPLVEEFHVEYTL